MKNKTAILYCLFGAISFVYLWYILLLVPYPECDDIYTYLKDTIFHMFTLEESPIYFYMSSLASILICFLTGLWIMLGKNIKIAIGIVSIHTLLAVLFYGWELILVVALPLTALLGKDNA